MSTVQVFYDGTDITNNVLFHDASFECQLGAQPGQFSVTVKDLNRTLSFATGKEIQVYIDGTLFYGGFVLQVTKEFAFPVDRTDDISAVKTRMWKLQGSDYNILFDRRFLYNKATPTTYVPPVSGHPTDAYVLNQLTSLYLDVDDVDTTTHVSVVATDAAPGDTADPNPGYGFQGGVGTSWRHQMQWLASRTGAIWYIDAAKKLWYFDRESTTPGWGFSDTPNKVTTFGFREIEVIEDASTLGNDALVWGGSEYGISGGTGVLNFGRATDSTSISNYFRSQVVETRFGELVTDVDCQNRANVIVYGDPGGALGGLADTHRGLQNPQRYIRLAWFDSGIPSPLIPGTVITVYLTVFGETITLPVRSVRLTFLSPTIVRYDGYFGVQTDDPFSLWKYMKKVADAGGTAGGTPTPTITPVSDGSATAVVAGTEVCMVPNGTIDGANVAFTTTDPYLSTSLRVWLNGLLQRPEVDYTETDSTVGHFSFTDAPLSGDQLWVCYTSA